MKNKRTPIPCRAKGMEESDNYAGSRHKLKYCASGYFQRGESLIYSLNYYSLFSVHGLYRFE